MNRRQFKKVHCQISCNGRTMRMSKRVPCRKRKEIREWIRSVLENEDVMICLHMKSKYGIDIKDMSEKERMWAVAKYCCLENGWKDAS